ncbi:MAG: pyrroloquinoline quinone biosynthesis protein PqqB [Planctomycetota bacterium]|nr:MAG: pyrroloquinoline quinone biosynthesis protein PqqB [Planctomycetota bacterium]
MPSIFLALFSILLGFSLAACTAPKPSEETEGPTTLARFLGAAQDGGMPHLGCRQELCSQARAHPHPLHRVACMAIEAADGRWWMLDATPDFPSQVEDYGSLPEAIFLTHAHIGHYTGLMYLGKESLHAKALPVYASPRMAEFLRQNGPWSQLVALGNIELRQMLPGQTVSLSEELQLTPLTVPHRDEFSDTVGFSLSVQNGKSLFYLPDIDSWDAWDMDLQNLADRHDYLCLDATFFSNQELPGRDMSQIPHPRVTDSMDRFQAAVDSGQVEVIFTHLNHSNPLWDTASRESALLMSRGFTTPLQRPHLVLK